MSRPVPADFMEHIHERTVDLHSRYGVGKTTLAKWYAEIGIKREPLKSGGKEKPLPADFAKVQEGRTADELQQRYKVGRQVVKRWLRQAGIDRTTQEYRELSLERARAASLASPNRFTPNNYMTAPVDRPRRDASRAGEAANYLRPDYIPVFRCRKDGRQDIAGYYWRCGRLILTDDEIIARADELKARRARRAA